MHAVGANDDASALLDCLSLFGSASNTHDTIPVEQQALDGKSFANDCPGFCSRTHKQVVQHRAPRTESAPAIIRVRNGPSQRKRADVERHAPADWRQTRPLQTV